MPFRPNASTKSPLEKVTGREIPDVADTGVNVAVDKMQPLSIQLGSSNPPRRCASPSNPLATVDQDVPSKLSLFPSKRRQSALPNTKPPMGPRPLENTGGKRSASNTLLHPASTIRTVPDASSEKVHETIPSPHEFSRSSFGPRNNKPAVMSQRSDNIELETFLEPAFNFDDFHTKITSTEPVSQQYLSNLDKSLSFGDLSEQSVSGISRISTHPAAPNSYRKMAGSGAIPRKSSISSTAALRSVATSDSSASLNTSVNARRQSHFPPTAFGSTGVSRPPRKSIGPGIFTAPGTLDSTGVVRRPSMNNRSSSSEAHKFLTTARATGKAGASGSGGGNGSRDGSKSPAKSKPPSMPARQPSKDLLTPSRTPDPFRAPSTNLLATPNKQVGTPGRTTTPGATTASRRMSTIPAHATGLGARTISPTDARRMKRLSALPPPAPPLPQTRISQAPPTPQPDPSQQFRPRSGAHSPVLASGKSLTPSSSRTTPDPSRKSYSSAQSLSSSTSYGSTRVSAINNIRLLQNPNSSRLPTPKPRLDVTPTSSTFEGEVPPVPAIPKAYESPSSELDQPYFSARSSSLPASDTPASDSPIVSTLVEAIGAIELNRASTTSNDLMKVHTDGEYRSKKFASTLSLPPLNLGPLNTPTTNKIQMLQDTKSSRPEPPATPSNTRTKVKTPSTPMTASKATFYSRTLKAPEDGMLVRSSTSHHNLRGEEHKTSDHASLTLPMFSFEADIANTRPISPYLSSSAPKSAGEFSGLMRPNFAAGIDQSSTKQRPNGPRAPSFSVTPKAEPVQSTAEKSTEHEFPFSPSALRRKLSRKRSETKLAVTPVEGNTSRNDSMPPPKLPASATWTNPNVKNSAPIQKPSYLKSRRQISGSGTVIAPERKDSLDSGSTALSLGRPSNESSRSQVMNRNRAGSLALTLPIPGVNKAYSEPQTQESDLDRDDLLAEEEMKKLASKRKDLDAAARGLDELRRRAVPARRMSATTATHTCDLNIFERGEIVDYPDVHFTGAKNARKIVGDLSSLSSNFGYDDERGDYNIVEGDHLAYRYEVIDVLGKGSFGQVVRCIDHKSGGLVAVKIIRNKKRFHQQALVEVNILQKLKEWDPAKKFSVVNFEESFYFRGHLCISTDLLGMNLYEFIKAHDFRGFSLKLIRRFTKQLLNSLVLLHNHKVIHCDLKPENILLAHPAQSEIKVIDFGSSCFENEKVYTYIQSRFYRSPEVILGMSYGLPIDMWSVGCILAELYTGYPIFPGENEQEQLACIMEIFGPPEKHLIEKSSRKKLFFDSIGKPRVTISSKGKRRRPSSKELRQVLKCDDECFLDFITKCLRWDPTRRLTPYDAIKHDFVTGLKGGAANFRKAPPSATNSPIKRFNSVSASGGTRPLPNPPATSLKLVSLTRSESLAPTGSKSSNRRQSAVNNSTMASQAKRASHAAMAASVSQPNLARIATGPRVFSGRTDLAAAAAAASLSK